MYAYQLIDRKIDYVHHNSITHAYTHCIQNLFYQYSIDTNFKCDVKYIE